MSLAEFKLQLTMRGLLTNTATGVSVPSEPLGTNQNGFEDSSFSLTDGTGELEADAWIVGEAEIQADDAIYELCDLNNEINNLGIAVSLDVVKYFYLQIVDPSADKVVHLGSFGASDGWLGWFGDDGTVAATQAYEVVHQHTSHASPYVGFDVENSGTGPGAGYGSKVLIRVPSSTGVTSVTVQYVIVGVQRV